MILTGEYRIHANRDVVWKMLNDPQILEQCIPGCEEIIQKTPTEWTARILAKVGPVKARFAGEIRLEDLDPPASCRIVGEGDGGAAGFASGASHVALISEGDSTVLKYDAEAQIGGKLMQIGARLIDGFAKKFADEFFAKFSALASGSPAEKLEGDGPSSDKEMAAAPSTARAVEGAHLPAQPYSRPAKQGFDAQSFTIVVLALLLAFMVVMYAYK